MRKPNFLSKSFVQSGWTLWPPKLDKIHSLAIHKAKGNVHLHASWVPRNKRSPWWTKTKQKQNLGGFLNPPLWKKNNYYIINLDHETETPKIGVNIFRRFEKTIRIGWIGWIGKKYKGSFVCCTVVNWKKLEEFEYHKNWQLFGPSKPKKCLKNLNRLKKSKMSKNYRKFS